MISSRWDENTSERMLLPLRGGGAVVPTPRNLGQAEGAAPSYPELEGGRQQVQAAERRTE